MNSTDFRATAAAKLPERFEPTQVLTASDIEHFRKLFTSLDANGDGWISREELRQLFVTEAEVEQALAAGDLDGDGGLSFDELLTTSAGQKLNALEQRAWAIFSGFDIEADGIVERAEITAIGDPNAAELAELLLAAMGEGKEIAYDAFLMWFAQRELS